MALVARYMQVHPNVDFRDDAGFSPAKPHREAGRLSEQFWRLSEVLL